MASVQMPIPRPPPIYSSDQCHFNLPEWKFHQELGNNRSNQTKSQFLPKLNLLSHLYSNMEKSQAFHPIQTIKHMSHGGIFNFDFSTDGSILIAACERKSFLLFDPLNGKLFGSKNNAHNDCVNYIRFLDSRTFASCSDDTTVKLWDSRYLKHCIHTLHGHSNWVKNIEYDPVRGLLLTSGFDGSVYSWDINNYSESGYVSKRVFHTNGLMRTKLSPDAEKLIVSTAGGYLMIIHDLDLTTLSEDLRGFKPDNYRLMQMCQSPIRKGYMYNHVFRGRRNRVEFVTDFPEGNDAEVLSSLQVHPHGWCVATRNVSSDENSEWTCLHDVQAYPAEASIAGHGDTDHYDDTAPHSEPTSANPSRGASPSFFLYIAVDDGVSSSAPSPSNPRSPSNALINPGSSSDNPDATSPVLFPCPLASSRHPETIDSSGPSNTNWVQVDSNDVIISNPELALTGSSETTSQTSHNTFTYITNTRSDTSYLQLLKPAVKHKKIRIYENRPRLQYYVEEPNVGRGFIKVLSFSNDGRIISSPFGYGTRLLALNDKCSELCDVYTNKAKPFHELTSCMSHKNVVLCTKFSPTHCLFVSGCLSGEVMFHQPVL